MLRNGHRGNSSSNPVVVNLERKICDQFGVRFCTATDLGRQAITLALTALGLQSGDGVVVPSFVCRSVILPILRQGCIPQFADIGTDLNISPESVERALNHKTRVIIVPHLYGRAAPIEEILSIAKRYDLAVIDDAAQAIGAKRGEQYVGTFGDIGIFSFGPFKSIMATRGGALLTNNANIYETISDALPLPCSTASPFIRALKSLIKFKLRKYFYLPILRERRRFKYQAEQAKFDFSETAPLGISQMDAAIALVQLEKLEKIRKRRILRAHYFSRLLEQCDWLQTPSACENHKGNVFVKYVIRLENLSTNEHRSEIITANRLIEYLRTKGIEAESAYMPLHLDEHLSSYSSQPLDSTEHYWQSLICLPLNPDTSHSDLRFMATCVKRFALMKP